MNVRKTKYKKLPCQGEAIGQTSLMLPFGLFWNQTKSDFLARTVRHLFGGVSIPNLDDVLSEFGFGPSTFSLDEWFVPFQPPVLRVPTDAASLKKCSEVAEDLTRDDGLWKADAADLIRPEQDAVADILRRVTQAKRQIKMKYGPKAFSGILETIHRSFKEAAQELNQVPMTARLAEELRQAALQFGSYAVPRKWVAKILIRFRPDLSATWWLTDSQRRNSERRLFPLLKSAVQLRFDQELHRHKRRVMEALLGSDGVQGLLDKMREETEDEEDFFRQLGMAVNRRSDELPPSSASMIYLARSLDTQIGPKARSLRHLYDESLRRAGCSPRDFANRIIQDGLMIKGRKYMPAEWLDLELPAVQQALTAEADRYLGSDDPEMPITPGEPHTAFAHARTISPLHPELESLLKNLIPSLAQRSKPYIELHNLTGAEPQDHALLYCYPADRRQWESLLQTWVTLKNSSNSGADMAAYALDRPHSIVLFRIALAVPLGGLKALPAWIRESILLEKSGNGQRLYDLPATPEPRRLAERPDDHESSRLLFGAACKARIFVAVAGTPGDSRYALATVDPQFDHLFARDCFEPDWKTEAFFHDRLKDGEFVRRLEVTFGQIPDLGTALRKLANEIDALAVCSSLVTLGILDPGATQHHFRIRSSSPGNLPLELFARKKGQLEGMTANECIAELHSNDDFFGTVSWQVHDALTWHRLSPNDVPKFLLELANI